MLNFVSVVSKELKSSFFNSKGVFGWKLGSSVSFSCWTPDSRKLSVAFEKYLKFSQRSNNSLFSNKYWFSVSASRKVRHVFTNSTCKLSLTYWTFFPFNPKSFFKCISVSTFLKVCFYMPFFLNYQIGLQLITDLFAVSQECLIC